MDKDMIDARYKAPPEPAQALAVAHMSKVRFAVLIDKTLKGEKLKFHRRR